VLRRNARRIRLDILTPRKVTGGHVHNGPLMQTERGAGHPYRSYYSIIQWNDGALRAPFVAEAASASELEQASAMFRALGDPARLRLLARLAGREVCVTELADLEDEKLTTVSARLRTLYEARLVKRRREAKLIYYALSDTHVLRLVQSAMEHAAEKV
jgi:DNA-binding transcriptional ArsR family regulator